MPPARTGCRKASVRHDLIQRALCEHVLPSLSGTVQEQWRAIQRACWVCCTPRTSRKFRGSDYLKQLCAWRHGVSDVDERIGLGRLIMAIRAHEKMVWWQRLEGEVAGGDSEAIAYLRQRARIKANNTNLVLSYGGRQQAARAIQSHFHSVLASASQLEIDRSEVLWARLREQSGRAEVHPFTCDEVRTHMSKYAHSRKTSGMSGVPNEFLAALARDEDGILFLCNHLTKMMCHPEDAPEDYVKSFVCLIPKVSNLRVPKDFRPISLLESSLKLCTGLMFRRWLAKCSFPDAQHGGLPGCRTLTCLMAAQQLLYLEYKTNSPSLWLLVDIQQAFDSLSRSQILQYLLNGPQGLSKEAAALFHYLKSRMVFRWGKVSWEEDTSTGTQQGSPPSAGLFALILGEALDALFHEWDSQGTVRARHRDQAGRPLHGWAFADDCIFSFLGWRDFKLGIESLIGMFAELGLSINLSKTFLVVHPSMLEDGMQYFRDDPLHCGFQCQWVQEGKHLQKPFAHYQGGAQPVGLGH